jgi:hypothetical protein
MMLNNIDKMYRKVIIYLYYSKGIEKDKVNKESQKRAKGW